MSKPLKRFFLVNFAAGGAFLALLWPVYRAWPTISLENGLLENLQAAFLGAEILLLGVSGSRWLKREDAWIGLFLAAGVLTMLLRELDLDRLPVPSFLAAVGSGFGRNLLWGLVWAVVLAVAVKKRDRLAGWIRRGFSSPWGWFLLLGGGGYVMAELFDHKIIPLGRANRLFFEEALETLAVIWLGSGILGWAVGNKVRNSESIRPFCDKNRCNSSMK